MPVQIRTIFGTAWKYIDTADIPGGTGTVGGGGETAAVQWNPGAVELGTASYAYPADAIFVAKNGSDSGAGTEASPYLTLAKAATMVQDNGTIVMRAGSYQEGGPQYYPLTSGTSGLGRQVAINKANVTLQNYPGETVWIDGSQVVTGWASASGGTTGTVYRAPFAMNVNRAPTEARGEAASAQYGSFTVPEFPYPYWCEMVFIDGVSQEQVQSLSAVGPGKFFVEGAAGPNANDFLSTNYVIGTNPAGKEVRIATLSRAIGWNGIDGKIRGIGFRRYNTATCDFGVVYVSKIGLNLENTVWEDIATRGLHFAAKRSLPLADPPVVDAVIRKSTFRRLGQIGFGMGCDGAIVEHNYFEENNNRRFNYGPDAGCFKIGRIQTGLVRYNHFHKTYGHACWLDEVCYKVHIHGNLFTDNYGCGVMSEIGDGNIIADNIFVNNGILSTDVASRPPYACPAIRVSGANNNVIWGNTIFNSEVGIMINQDPRIPYAAGSFGWDARFNQAWYAANCTWDITNCVVKNNAVLGSTGMNQTQASLIRTGNASGRSIIWTGVLKNAGNLYTKFSSTQPTRFALSYPDGTNIKIHTSLTNSGTGTYDPPVSWATAYGETGSVYVTDAAPIDTTNYKIKSSLLTSPAVETPPADVAALLAASPFIPQRVGAGYMVTNG